MSRSVRIADLPDDILLRILSCFVFEQVTEAETTTLCQQEDGNRTLEVTSTSTPLERRVEDVAVPCNEEPASIKKQKRPPKARKGNRQSRTRAAGSGVQTLCRLCCCSRRFNHLASADQLWQPLTLARFPDRHWPTTDQESFELIRIQRERLLKLLEASTSGPTSDPDSATRSPNPWMSKGIEMKEEGRDDGFDSKTTCGDSNPTESTHGKNIEQEESKEQKPTRFYSRFEQRAFRRRFASLDPELKYTPLAWTNTLWTWKRTFFGDYRFVGAKDIETPNRIGRLAPLHRSLTLISPLAGEPPLECQLMSR